MPITAYQLLDVVQPDVLQQLQDSFAAVSGHAAMIVSPEGNPYTAPYGNCMPEMELLRSLVIEAGQSDAPAYARQSGDHYYAIPIQMKGAYLGSWILCCKRALGAKALARIAAHLDAISRVMEGNLHAEHQPERYRLHRREDEGERALLNKLAQQLAGAKAQGRAFSIAMVNLDGLAYVNSAYGHKFGDLLLSNTASSIRTVIRAEDIIGRLQGDTFVVALPGCDRKMAEQRIREGREKLGQLKLIGSTESFTFTFGLVEYTEFDDEGLDEEQCMRGLLELAEHRMRENKRSLMLGYARF